MEKKSVIHDDMNFLCTFTGKYFMISWQNYEKLI